MPSIELTAKTEQEATALAAEKLGVPAESLTVTVLEKTKGLFGKSSVRIKAEAPEAKPKPEPKAKPAKEEKVEAAPEPEADKKPAARRGRTKPEPEAEAAPVVEAKPEPKAADRPSRGRGKKEDAPKEEGAADERSEYVATEADGDEAIALVQELLEAGDLSVTASVGSLQGRYVTVTIDGKDVAHLVGKHGEVLNAMQYLVNIIGQRRFSNPVRVTLDGNDYRRRREDALTKLATRIAEQVKERGEEAVLDALPAFERRIVHKAISELDGVTTYSEGEEPNRRVVIAPVD